MENVVALCQSSIFGSIFMMFAIVSCSMKKLNFSRSWKNILTSPICDSDFGFELFPIASLKNLNMGINI